MATKNKITAQVFVTIDGRTSVGSAAITALTKRLKRASRDRRKCARDVLNKYAIKIQRTAKRNLKKRPVRFDEGILSGSIKTFVSTLLEVRLGAQVFTNLGYAPFVHWGTGIHGESPEGGHRRTPWVYWDEKHQRFVFTRGMKPNPFLLDAFETHHKKFIIDMKKCLSDPS